MLCKCRGKEKEVVGSADGSTVQNGKVARLSPDFVRCAMSGNFSTARCIALSLQGLETAF